MKPMPLLTCLLLLMLVQAIKASGQQAQETIIQSVHVLPMVKEEVITNQDVVIRKGAIASIGPAGKYKPQQGALIINGAGKYLVPGLAEMHAHVPPVNNLEPMKEVLLLFLANGVTHIRGMLGHPKHLELKAKIRKGEVQGPSFYTSGPSANGNSVPTPEAAIQLVQEQKLVGYDFIKIHPGIKLKAFQALSKKAKEVKLPFAGHVPSDVGIWNAVDLGLLTIDHLDGMLEALVPGKERFAEGAHGFFGSNLFMEADTVHVKKLMTELQRKKVWVVPTQALAERWISPEHSAAERSKEPEMQYMDKQTVANWLNTKNNMEGSSSYQRNNMPRYIELRRKLIKACQQNGVRLLLGSDAPQVFNVPGFSVHHELQYLVDAGLSPYQALSCGTVNVGTFYGNQKMGTIQNGAPADLVLLGANPLENIQHTKLIEGVMINGKWLDKKWINETLAAIANKKK
ncbi:Imidazolonepropionase [Cnuella takakiae]|uniref:Imidazolonepropionase n=1 Tax=Cnuella takakiae TaxID=1302690 RepID=A0A1M5BDN6_9BACT|nr:amidohydrolase family protein [Cnuella takakiae]OLY93443.1 amidohydrolase [Cnuella takakiae]SHF40614.1 Imidazolonepropionase [Cnuella takakiae]